MTDTIAATPATPAPGNVDHQTPVNPVLRGFAHVISYVFHPLFINVYVMAFLIFLHPYAFAGFDHRIKVLRLLHVVFVNAFLPLFSVFLMWRLQFIQTMMLRTQKDRIIPYIATMFFYFWTWWVYKNLEDIPVLAVHFLLGSFLAVFAAFFCNIFYKVSMHAVAMGGALMFFFLFGFHDIYGSGLYIAAALLLTGLVCTSRLILSAHSGFEVWSGLFVGMLTQLIAWQF
ncbi:MAG TPA: hypothetical protein VNU70_03900 [Puia sp.]|nr:hypothetical protein [Puia sp.]